MPVDDTFRVPVTPYDLQKRWTLGTRWLDAISGLEQSAYERRLGEALHSAKPYHE